MNRIDRLQAILIQLQSKKVVKAHEIADRFEISLRTVYRDIRALEEGGIPIGAEAGIGYFLDESFALPPIMFTTKEAIALLLAGKLVPHMSDKKIDQAFQEALYKIKSVMRSDDKQTIDKLERSMRVYSGISEIPQYESLFLQEIQQALVEQKVIEFNYTAHYSQQNTKRRVEPVGLIFYSMNWHLIAWCQLRQDYRDFRLDRIGNAKLTDITYNRKLDKSLSEYLNREKEAQTYFEIELQISSTLAHWMHESKYWYGFISEEKHDKFTNMKFLNPDLHGFSRWIITMGQQVDIINPNELKSIMKVRVKELYDKYMG